MRVPKKLSQTSIDLLTESIRDEYSTIFLHRKSANWCANNGFMKAAEFFRKDAAGELTHATDIEDFLVRWNVLPTANFTLIPLPEFTSLVELVEKQYDRMYEIFGNYEDRSAKAFKEGDLATFDFLQKYRQIQDVAVAEYADMLAVLKGVSPLDKFQLLLLEKKLFG